MLSVAEARARILAGVKPLKAEMVGLDSARGRVLARDLKARHSQPPFDASSMDGYAVRSADIKTVPVSLEVIGEAPAGRAFNGVVATGEAVRIFTGAPVPEGADCIVMQENTSREGDRVRILQSAACGNFIRKSGLDFSHGDVILTKGLRLDARHIGLAAAMNHARIAVRRQPRVAILATGDELVPPGHRLGKDQIVASNSFALAAAVSSWGAGTQDLGIAPDRLEAIAGAIEKGRDADILITIGGASVGDHDLVAPAFRHLGIRLNFWRIAMRPGKPVMFAKRGSQRIIGVPGNPVSTMVSALVYIRPLINAMLGCQEDTGLLTARLGAPLAANDRRQDYLRAKLSLDSNGNPIATAYSPQDSSMQRIFAQSDCLIIRPPFARAARKGARVNILPLTF